MHRVGAMEILLFHTRIMELAMHVFVAHCSQIVDLKKHGDESRRCGVQKKEE